MKSPAGNLTGPTCGITPSPFQLVSDAQAFQAMKPYTKRATARNEGSSIKMATRRSRLSGFLLPRAATTTGAGVDLAEDLVGACGVITLVIDMTLLRITNYELHAIR